MSTNIPYVEVKMVLTKRYPCPGGVDVTALDRLSEFIVELRELAQEDKIDAMQQFLYNDKKSEENISDEDFSGLFFIAVINDQNI